MGKKTNKLELRRKGKLPDGLWVWNEKAFKHCVEKFSENVVKIFRDHSDLSEDQKKLLEQLKLEAKNGLYKR
jgi:hypothetical protein